MMLYSEKTRKILSTEILPRLPTKSLFRFKCVSKSFESLISSPHLAKLHLHLSHSLSSSDGLLIFNSSTDALYAIDMGSSLSSKNNAIKLHLPKTHGNLDIPSIIGSCNGLLCIRNYRDFYIFNPLLHKCNYRKIPLAYDGFGRVDHGCFSFGYDSAADDYKIVWVLHSHHQLPSPTFGIYSYTVYFSRKERNVMVYSLRAESWKSIQNPWPCDHGNDAINGVLIGNSLLHWMFYDSQRKPTAHYIGCFDLNNEQVVDDLPLPADDADLRSGHHPRKYNLGVLDGCLCLSTMIEAYQPSSRVHVLIMKEYGVKESWVKLASISYGSGISINDLPIVTPIAYSLGSKHEVLLHDDYKFKLGVESGSGDRSKLIWYDLSNGKTRLADFRGLDVTNETTRFGKMHWFSCFRWVFLYRPSLVTVPSE